MIGWRFRGDSFINKRVAYSMMLVGVFMLVGVGLLCFQPPQIIGGEADAIEVSLTQEEVQYESVGRMGESFRSRND
jgi:hypothetical protein